MQQVWQFPSDRYLLCLDVESHSPVKTYQARDGLAHFLGSHRIKGYPDNSDGLLLKFTRLKAGYWYGQVRICLN